MSWPDMLGTLFLGLAGYIIPLLLLLLRMQREVKIQLQTQVLKCEGNKRSVRIMETE